MKLKLFTLSLFTFCTIVFAVAQVPQGINYQAVARNSSGTVLQNQHISVRLSVHDVTAGGTVVYQESDTTTTNQFGLFNVVIGNGTVLQGTFAGIVWGTGSKFLQVELDPAGGSSYADMGTTQLQSVPYAQYAGNVTPVAGVGFSVYSDSIQTLSSGTHGISFSKITYDQGNNFSADGFTAPSDGVYNFSSAIRFDGYATAGNYTWIGFDVNSALQCDVTSQTSTNNWGMTISRDLKLNAGDKVTVVVFSPGTFTTSSSNYNVWFTGHKVY